MKKVTPASIQKKSVILTDILLRVQKNKKVQKNLKKTEKYI